MQFHLVYSQGTEQKHESFRTEAEAVAKACILIEQGGYTSFLVENDRQRTVKTEAEIRNLCKST
jgi:hypothetical protein